MNLTIQILTREHKRDGFDCGVPALNEFLQRHARQNQERNISRTYVATRLDDLRVVGFYSLTSSAIRYERLPEPARRRLPRYPIPVVHLGRLATDVSMRGQGVGSVLLLHAFERVLQVADIIGIHAIEVTAKDDTARAFYQKFGFRSLPDNDLNLFLPVDTIRTLLG